METLKPPKSATAKPVTMPWINRLQSTTQAIELLISYIWFVIVDFKGTEMFAVTKLYWKLCTIALFTKKSAITRTEYNIHASS